MNASTCNDHVSSFGSGVFLGRCFVGKQNSYSNVLIIFFSVNLVTDSSLIERSKETLYRSIVIKTCKKRVIRRLVDQA